jgi:hypothetical protein
MHIVLKQRNETLTIKTPDAKIFKITFFDGQAFVPEQIGRFMIEKGFVTQGPETQNPKPEFEALAGGWGKQLPLFHKFCIEITPTQQEQPT